MEDLAMLVVQIWFGMTFMVFMMVLSSLLFYKYRNPNSAFSQKLKGYWWFLWIPLLSFLSSLIGLLTLTIIGRMS